MKRLSQDDRYFLVLLALILVICTGGYALAQQRQVYLPYAEGNPTAATSPTAVPFTLPSPYFPNGAVCFADTPTVEYFGGSIYSGCNTNKITDPNFPGEGAIVSRTDADGTTRIVWSAGASSGPPALKIEGRELVVYVIYTATRGQTRTVLASLDQPLREERTPTP